MKIGRRPRLAAILATSLGGVLVAGALAFAPGSAVGETTAAAEPAPIRTQTGWAVTNLASALGHGSPQTHDLVDVDAEGTVVAARWRPCTRSACGSRSYLRVSSDAGRTFGPPQIVDDAASTPVVAVSAATVLTASPAVAGPGTHVVRVQRWIRQTPTSHDLAVAQRPVNLRLAASGERGVLAFRVGSTVMSMRTENAGASWSTPVVVGTSNGSLDVGIEGTRAVVVLASGGGTWSVRVSDDAGATWGAAHGLATSSDDAAVPRVAVTPSGRIALAGSHLEASRRRGDVRTSLDGTTWSPAASLAWLSATQVVDLAADGENLVASGDGLSLRRSTGGASWGFISEHHRVVSSMTSGFLADASRTSVAVASDGVLTMHGSTLLRSFPDTRAPSVRLTAVPPAVTTKPDQVVRFTGADADAADAWLMYECAYGANEFRPCTSPHNLREWYPHLHGSDQSLRVRATDAAGRVSPVATTRWMLDQAAPDGPYQTGGKSFSLRTAHTFRWSAFDADSGVASYDVRYSTTSQTASRMSRSWRTSRALTRRQSPSVRLAIPRGKAVCVQARAHDRAGRVSAWSGVGCMSRPYDDRALRRSGVTKKVRDRRHLNRVATRLTKSGRLTLRGVEAGSIVYVVYKRTPSMGAGHLRPRGNVNFVFGERGPTRFRQVWRFDDAARRGGSVSIAASRPGSIVIDGLAVVPRWAQ
ncbi:exo-alpha-sialidase [Mumia sp. zg.B53]|uniref:WD40/YVTN/BNR-like repeat-containing protein n=1 Tax=Mumia sp. zg.B53 TaxID=2855449 RepID=UPI001C6DF817|nr:glycoside hydrolase [Mumia sp. zg.B53]MBW9216722.1 exo-alpha-sialidase [Mumia sp. zg.B53]